MNQLLHPLHAPQVVDDLERRILDAASGTPGQEWDGQEWDGQEREHQPAADATEITEPPD